MAITRYAGDRFTIAAGETKPTGVLDGAVLIDTGNLTQHVKRTVAGTSQWSQIAGGGGGGSPGGTDTQVQFNNAGAFGGDADLTFTDGNRLNVNKLGISGNIYDSNNSIGNNGMVLTNEGTTGVNWKAIEDVLSGVGGSGVANYVARWADEDTLTTGVLVDNGTNVGINVPSPNYPLEISSSSNATVRIEDTTNNSRLDLRAEDSAVLIRSTSNFPMRFDVNQTERMRIDTAGKVGIGTNNPSGNLEIWESTVNTPASLKLTGDPDAGANTEYANIIFHSRDSSTGANGGEAQIRAYRGGDRDAPYLNFDLADTVGVLQQVMTIHGQNNAVGIGTTSPTTKLHVYGADPVLTIQDSESTVANASAILRIGESDTSANLNNNFALKFAGSASGGDLDISRYNNTSLAAQGVRIKHDGNVGIGTNSPQGKLDINTEVAQATHVYINGEVNQDKLLYFRHYANSEGAGNNAYVGYIGSNGIDNLLSLGHLNSSGTDVPIMHLTEAGYVGIGTTSPDYKLHVSSPTTSAAIGITGSGGSKDTWSITSSDNSSKGVLNFRDEDSSTTVLTLRQDGNVGIGNTNPTRKLSVYNSAAGSIANFLHYTDPSNYQGLYIDVSQTTDIVNLKSSGSSSGGFAFFAGTDEKVRIDSSGKVGIGTDDPDSLLHIDTGANSAANFRLGANRTAANAAVGQVLGDWDGTIVSKIAFKTGGDTTNKDNGEIAFEVAAAGSTAEAMRIASNGNVGIGTTVPSQKLHVQGNLRVTGAYYASDNNAGSSNQVLTSTGSGGTDWKSLSQIGDTVTGSGTTNKITKWSDGPNSDLTDSSFLSESGTTLTNTATATEFTTTNTQLRLPNYGRVAIGAASTNSVLLADVGDNATFNNGEAVIKGENSGNRGAVGHASGSDLLRLNFSNALGMILNKDGHVGISTDPKAKLEVDLNQTNGTLAADNYAHFGGKHHTNGSVMGITLGYREANLLYRKVGIVARGLGDNQARQDLAFLVSTVNSSASVTPADAKLTISGLTGNVGIGTTAPTGAKLQVAGGIRINNGSKVYLYTSNDLNYLTYNRWQVHTGTALAIDNTSTGGFQVQDSGVPVLFVGTDSTYGGRVGIGTVTPSQKLHVVGKALITDDVQLTGSNPRIDFNTNGASSLRFYDTNNAAERMRINTSGNLGINTTSPTSKLQVVGSTSGDSVLRIDGTNGTLFEVVDDLSGSLMSVNDAAGLPVFEVFADNHIVAGRYNQNDFYLNTDGNLGLGTGSPDAKLHIKAPASSVPAEIRLEHNGGGTQTAKIVFDQSGQNKLVLSTQYQSSTDLNLIQFAPADNVAMTIRGGTGTSDGFVGIGTDNPDSLIHISGASNGTQTYARFSTGPLNGDQNLYIQSGSTRAHMALQVKTGAAVVDDLSLNPEGGNVGIGTTGPGSKLHVYGGTTAFTNLSDNIDSVQITRNASVHSHQDAKLFIYDNSNSDYAQKINLAGYSYGLRIEGFVDYGLEVHHQTLGLVLVARSSELVINDSGNDYNFRVEGETDVNLLVCDASADSVGIGGPPNSSYKLDISGDTLIQESESGDLKLVVNNVSTSTLARSAVSLINNSGSSAGLTLPSINYTGVTGWANRLILNADSNISNGILVRPSSGGFTVSANGLANANLRVDTTGKVGIGTVSPDTQLHIDSGSGIGTVDNAYSLAIRGDGIDGIQILSDSAYSGRIVFGDQNSNNVGRIYYDHSTDAFRFFTNGTEKVSILSDGNVGIGTTAPGYKLDVVTPASGAIHVRSTAQTHGLLMGSAAYSSGDSYVGLKTTVMTGSSDYMIISGGTSDLNTYISAADTYSVKIRGGGNNTTNEIIVTDSGNNTYSAGGFHYFQSGNIGIGVAPTQKLHVQGNLRVTGAFYDSNNAAGASGQVLTSTGSATDWKDLDEISGVTASNPTTTNYVTKWSDGTNEVITDSLIYDNGTKVSIGTASPLGKLDVYRENSGAPGLIARANKDGAKMNFAYTNNNSMGEIGTTYNNSTGAMRLWIGGNLNSNSTGHVGPTQQGTSSSSWFSEYNTSSDYYQINRIAAGGGTSSSTLFYITSTGNVGIGGVTPTLGKLQVAGRGYFGPVGTGDATTKALMDTYSVLKLKPHNTNSTNMTFAQVNNGGGIGIQVTNGTQTADWDIALNPYGGNVGIGVTDPDALLEVKNSDRFQLKVSGWSPDGAGASAGAIQIGDTDAYCGRIYVDNTNTKLHITNTYNNGNGDIVFLTKTAGTANNVMTLKGNGNVGIGITNPDSGLNIAKAQTSAHTYTTNHLHLSTPTTSNNGGATTISFATSTVDNYGWSLAAIREDDVGTDTRFAFKSHINSDSGNERFSILANGNVGIGITSPGHVFTVRKSSGAVNTPVAWIHNSGNFGNYDGTVISCVNDGADAEVLHVRTNNTTYSNGTSLMLVRGDGHVGIGITNPFRELEIHGTGNVYARITASTDNDSAGLELNNNGNEIWVLKADDTANDYFKISNNAGTAFTIDTSRRVGIGTTTPATKLHVSGGATDLPIIRLQRNDTSVQPNNLIGGIENYSNDLDGAFISSYIKGYATETYGRQGYLTFGTAGTNSTDAAEKMRIASNGKVGISTTNPAEKLHVNGNAVIGDSTLQNATLTIRATNTAGSPAATAKILMEGYEGRGIGTFYTDSTYSGEEWFCGMNYSGNFNSWNIGYDQAGGQAEYLANTLFQLHHNGKLQLHAYGAGTFTGTATQRLAVDASGNVIEIAGGIIDGSGTEDYVARWTDTDTLGIGKIRDDNSTVAINTAPDSSYMLKVAGNGYFSGTLTEASSLAIKENIENFTPSIDKINKIRPVKYNKKGSDKKEIGLIAEELEELFPELVEKDENGNPSGVNYSRAVTVLLGGFKELYKELQEIKKRI